MPPTGNPDSEYSNPASGSRSHSGATGSGSSSSTSAVRNQAANGTNSQTASSPITIDSALKSANGDPLTALDMVLAERNMLSTQNASLWKLVEKQKSLFNSAQKELDKVKAERDKALAKSNDPPVTSQTSQKQNPKRGNSDEQREFLPPIY